MDKALAQRLAHLEAQAIETEKRGIKAGIEDGTTWAFTQLPTGEWCVTDGQRLWTSPRLVKEYDIIREGIVTRRLYLRNVPRVERGLAVSDYTCADGEQLLELLPIHEVVIFDHTKEDGHHRAKREVIQLL